VKTKIQIKSLWGSVLFEFEKEDNTIRETVEEAIKSGANLSGANLSGMNLSGMNLSGIDLSRSNLSRTNLSWTNLSKTDLSEANLSEADLFGSNLSKANLSGTNLSKANLSRVNLFGVDLSGVDLKKIIHLFRIVPEEGSFIAWKKSNNGYLIKLEIPAKAKRHNYIASRKCRAEFVKVLEIWDGKKKIREFQNCTHNQKITYKIGKLVYPDKYNPDPLVECSNGIHFFLTKQEAKDWNP